MSAVHQRRTRCTRDGPVFTYGRSAGGGRAMERPCGDKTDKGGSAGSAVDPRPLRRVRLVGGIARVGEEVVEVDAGEVFGKLPLTPSHGLGVCLGRVVGGPPSLLSIYHWFASAAATSGCADSSQCRRYDRYVRHPCAGGVVMVRGAPAGGGEGRARSAGGRVHSCGDGSPAGAGPGRRAGHQAGMDCGGGPGGRHRPVCGGWGSRRWGWPVRGAEVSWWHCENAASQLEGRSDRMGTGAGAGAGRRGGAGWRSPSESSRTG